MYLIKGQRDITYGTSYYTAPTQRDEDILEKRGIVLSRSKLNKEKKGKLQNLLVAYSIAAPLHDLLNKPDLKWTQDCD